MSDCKCDCGGFDSDFFATRPIEQTITNYNYGTINQKGSAMYFMDNQFKELSTDVDEAGNHTTINIQGATILGDKIITAVVVGDTIGYEKKGGSYNITYDLNTRKVLAIRQMTDFNISCHFNSMAVFGTDTVVVNGGGDDVNLYFFNVDSTGAMTYHKSLSYKHFGAICNVFGKQDEYFGYTGHEIWKFHVGYASGTYGILSEELVGNIDNVNTFVNRLIGKTLTEQSIYTTADGRLKKVVSYPNYAIDITDGIFQGMERLPDTVDGHCSSEIEGACYWKDGIYICWGNGSPRFPIISGSDRWRDMTFYAFGNVGDNPILDFIDTNSDSMSGNNQRTTELRIYCKAKSAGNRSFHNVGEVCYHNGSINYPFYFPTHAEYNAYWYRNHYSAYYNKVRYQGNIASYAGEFTVYRVGLIQLQPGCTLNRFIINPGAKVKVEVYADGTATVNGNILQEHDSELTISSTKNRIVQVSVLANGGNNQTTFIGSGSTQHLGLVDNSTTTDPEYTGQKVFVAQGAKLDSSSRMSNGSVLFYTNSDNAKNIYANRGSASQQGERHTAYIHIDNSVAPEDVK